MTEPVKVLILTADAGFGHRAAANAIAQALAERYGDACETTILNPLEDRRAPALLRFAQDDYDRMIRETPGLYKFGYEASDGTLTISLVEQGLVALLFVALRDVLQAHRPDAIITTYPLYQAPLAANFALARHYIPLFTVVTDLVSVHGLWFNRDADKCLVPTQAVLRKALESGLPEERIEVTGLPVNPALAHPVDRAELRSRLGLSRELAVALLVGGKRVHKLEPVADLLNHSGLPLELVLVAGGDEELHARWAAMTWHRPAQVHGFVQEMIPFLQAADFVVSKAGGLIVSEALAAGRPLLLVEALPGQETGNAQYVVEGGAGVLAEDATEALRTACHWLEHEAALLREAAANAARLGAPGAAARVAELAYEAARQGPSRNKHWWGENIPLLERILSGLELGLG